MRGPLALIVTLLAPALAGGAELSLGHSSSVEYDSNVLRTAAGEVKGDVVFRTTQRMQLSERGDGYSYGVWYRVPYQVSVRTGAVNDFNHYGGGRISYDLGPQTTVEANGSFAFVNSRSTVQDELEDEEGTTVIQIAKEDELNTRANADMMLRHRFTGRLNGSFNVSYSHFDSTDPDRREVNTIGALTSLNYAVSARNHVGFGANFSYQDFADLIGQPGSETSTYRIFASWVYRFDETLSFSIRAGPTWIDTTQRGAAPVVEFPSAFVFQEVQKDGVVPIWFDSNGDGSSDLLVPNFPVTTGDVLVSPIDRCGALSDDPATRVTSACQLTGLIQNTAANAGAIDAVVDSPPTVLTFVDPPGPPPSFDDQKLTLFGTIRVDKRWSPRLNSGVSYRRSQSNASGLGGSTILDAVNATVNWRVSPLWTASLRAGWTQRQSVAPGTFTAAVVEASADPELQDVGVELPPGAELGGGVDPADLTLPEVAELNGDRVFRRLQNEVDTRRWAVGGRIERTITPRLKADLRLLYNRQVSRSGSAGKPTDFENFLAIFGFSYRFDSIELW